MTSSGDIDYDSYKALVRWHIEEGTHGLCVLGTTGEAAVMSMEERDRVLKATMEAKGDSDISIIVGEREEDCEEEWEGMRSEVRRK